MSPIRWLRHAIAERTERIRCSFCGKDADQVRNVPAGPRQVFICDECVAACVSILDQHRDQRPAPPPSINP